MDITKSNINDWKEREPDYESSEEIKQNFIEYIKKTLGSISFAEDVVALYLLFSDPEYPAIKKGIAVFALFYFISPVDLVPDTIPIAGFFDDAGVIAAAVRMYYEDLPEYKGKAKIWLKNNGFN